MLALLGSLIGFATSIVPEFFKISQDKRDKLHELEILDRQAKAQGEAHLYKMAELNAMADIEEGKVLHKRVSAIGIRWVDALNGTVRPVLAYSFFALYSLVKIMIIRHLELSLPWQAALIWTEFDNAIFASVISYYFGARAMDRVMGRK